MERGTVKWFDEEKGYGFLLSTTDNKEYFVHRTQVEDLEGALEKGQVVEFEIGEGKRGPMAVNVRVLVEGS